MAENITEINNNYITCSKCGKQNDVNNKLCFYCGAELSSTPNVSNVTSSSETVTDVKPVTVSQDNTNDKKEEVVVNQVEKETGDNIFCGNCGGVNDKNNFFCVHCGAALKPEVSLNNKIKEEDEKKKNGVSIVIAIILSVILVIFVPGSFFFVLIAAFLSLFFKETKTYGIVILSFLGVILVTYFLGILLIIGICALMFST